MPSSTPLASAANASTSVLLPTPGSPPIITALRRPAQAPRQRRPQAVELRCATHRRGPSLGLRLHRGRRYGTRGEARVVLEDPALELARRVARGQPELAQPCGQPPVRLERLDLPAGAVEREHQRRDELLAQRVDRDQAAEHGDGLERAAERHERAGAALLRLRAQVLEPADLRLRPLRVGQVAERRPAPQRERAVERLQRGAGREPGRGVHAALEPVRVDLVGRDGEPVAGPLAHEQGGRRTAVAPGLQVGAQVGDADGQRARGGVARDALPGGLEQRVGRHGAPRVDEQPRQDGALLGAGGRGAGGRPVDLDRAEDAEVHGADLTGAAAGRKRAVAGR